jgi:hypothetical protein
MIVEAEKEFLSTNHLSSDTIKQVQDLLPILDKIICPKVQENLGITKIKTYLPSKALESTSEEKTQEDTFDANENIKSKKCKNS